MVIIGVSPAGAGVCKFDRFDLSGNRCRSVIVSVAPDTASEPESDALASFFRFNAESLG
jgi:hypothetical protein